MNRVLPTLTGLSKAIKCSTISYFIYVLFFIIQSYLSYHIASLYYNFKKLKILYTTSLELLSSFSENEMQLILNEPIFILHFQSAAS